jgi:hypothetical protein
LPGLDVGVWSLNPVEAVVDISTPDSAAIHVASPTQKTTTMRPTLPHAASSCSDFVAVKWMPVAKPTQCHVRPPPDGVRVEPFLGEERCDGSA